VSPSVQALLSVHVVPFAIGVVPQVPDVVSQVGFWHAPAGHDFIVPGAHAPLWQLSPTVHAFPSLQVVPFVTGTQLPVVDAHMLQVAQAAPEFCHAPFASHDCGWVPAQVFEPGVHTPVHMPLDAAQTYGHAAPFDCQVPFTSQSCGCKPLQVFEPGVQTPVHEPVDAAQTYVHAVPFVCQVPVVSHCCGCRPLHCFDPGEHTPVHAPPLQM
jgi:hypothetical protein